MCLARSLVPYAHMWSAIVVEINESADVVPCLMYVGIGGLAIELLCLDYAIDALCYSVVGGFVVLCHAYLCSYALECLHICVAAVLYASV